MTKLACAWIAALSFGANVACTPLLVAPAGFVDVSGGEYDFRATTADGLVIGVRQIEHETKGDLAFWQRAIENEMRIGRGYALLEAREVKTRRGLTGQQLRFGHDEAAEPHLYYVSVFITDDTALTAGHIYVVEAGGKKALMEANEATLQNAVQSLDAD